MYPYFGSGAARLERYAQTAPRSDRAGRGARCGAAPPPRGRARFAATAGQHVGQRDQAGDADQDDAGAQRRVAADRRSAPPRRRRSPPGSRSGTPSRRGVRGRGLFARQRRLAPARRLGVLDQPREVVRQVRARDARRPEQRAGARVVEDHVHVEVREVDLRLVVGVGGAGAGRAGRDDRRALLAERGRGHPDQVVDRARLAPADQVHDARGRGVLEQVHQRVGDVVHRHDVDERLRARRDLREQPARERADRPVQDVERGRPAGAGLAHHDRRAGDHGVQVRRVVDDVLGLPLGLLVGVAELLARVELALAERALGDAGDVRGGDVDEAVQAPAGLRLAGEADDLARALDVDLARLVERQVERDRGRAVHHRARPPRRPAPARRGPCRARAT